MSSEKLECPGKKQYLMEETCAVAGPTCDSFDKVTVSARLPGNLEIGDLFYTKNIGAYTIDSSTRFNGFESARICHLLQLQS